MRGTIQKQSQQMKRNKIYYHHDHHQPDHHQHHQHQHQHPGLRRRLPKNPLPHLHNNNLVYKFRERRAVNAIVGECEGEAKDVLFKEKEKKRDCNSAWTIFSKNPDLEQLLYMFYMFSDLLIWFFNLYIC
ncbi:uncharacterized protein LOC111815366 isoform X2 [Octodon degus]|uniref:Uncharacterized protein LOC111815366 isoform X2 n=1 Tax=Octodon degus TaxID=10160 RepID=A0A6P6E0M3_OCTDE|nr:uncharacterized protein LOC111815366 isoform X2 [Octodon degus]